MKVVQWYYRGSLRSCNYGCTYCPFSKKNESKREWERDEEGLYKFVERFCELLKQEKTGHGLLFMPYGEALVRDYYWRSMARLTRIRALEKVGAQTNLSFNIEESLEIFEKQGGDAGKLSLVCSFHPQMVSEGRFLEACWKLWNQKISFSVGAVGDVDHIEQIVRLKEGLPSEVYFWINRKDGRENRGREVFTGLDAHYELEFVQPKADPRKCQESYFVHEDGSVYGCCLSRLQFGNIYAMELDGLLHVERGCDQKRCRCYQAYCHGMKDRLEDLGRYPAFRSFVDKSM